MKELDTFVQQHQVSEFEAIKVVALNFEGKAYAWWLFESFSLKNANTSTYEKFIIRVVERFDEIFYETPLVELDKPKQTNPLHELEGNMNPNPL